MHNLVSYAEQDGMSLENDGNANAIKKLIMTLLDRGIESKDITILVIYQAQAKVIMKEMGTGDDGSLCFDETCTADSFQGRQNRIIILDVVVAEK